MRMTKATFEVESGGEKSMKIQADDNTFIDIPSWSEDRILRNQLT